MGKFKTKIQLIYTLHKKELHNHATFIKSPQKQGITVKPHDTNLKISFKLYN